MELHKLCQSCEQSNVCRFTEKIKEVQNEIDKLSVPVYSTDMTTALTNIVNRVENASPFYVYAGCIYHKSFQLIGTYPYRGNDTLFADASSTDGRERNIPSNINDFISVTATNACTTSKIDDEDWDGK